MPSHSAAERIALAGALAAAGPGAPTLCSGWTTNELAAHLVVREQRPDTLPGLILSPRNPLHRWTSRVGASYAGRDYNALVERFRTGPHLGSWAALPGIDARVNLLEHFIHTEDVRRAGPDWEPRDLPEDLDRALWTAIRKAGRMLLRRSAVPVVFRLPDGRSQQVVPGTGGSSNNRGRLAGVVISGSAAEIALLAYGRGQRSRASVDGPPEALAAFSALNLAV
jgi:uncharacterized protein (TIGR03085 family)